MTRVKEISGEDFEKEVMLESKLVVVKFWAPWCGPCKALAPILEEVASEKENDVKFIAINVDGPGGVELMKEYGLRGIPAVLYIKEGTAELIKMGNQTKEEILKNIQEVI